MTIPKVHYPKKLEKESFKTKDGWAYIIIGEINYIEASNNYSIIHRLDKTTVECIETIGEVMNKLPCETFFRIHNSTGANLNQVLKYIKITRMLEMENGVQIKVAYKTEKSLLAFFNKNRYAS